VEQRPGREDGERGGAAAEHRLAVVDVGRQRRRQADALRAGDSTFTAMAFDSGIVGCGGSPAAPLASSRSLRPPSLQASTPAPQPTPRRGPCLRRTRSSQAGAGSWTRPGVGGPAGVRRATHGRAARSRMRGPTVNERRRRLMGDRSMALEEVNRDELLANVAQLKEALFNHQAWHGAMVRTLAAGCRATSTTSPRPPTRVPLRPVVL